MSLRDHLLRRGRRDDSHRERQANAAASGGEEPIRVAVIGLEGVDVRLGNSSLAYFPWDTTENESSVGDCDAAIVNLLGFMPQDGIRRGLPKTVDGNHALELLRGVTRLILGGGEVIVLGHPDVHVWARSDFGFAWTTLPYWTGLQLTWETEPGNRVTINGEYPAYTKYLERIDRFTEAVLSAEVAEDFTREVQLRPRTGPPIEIAAWVESAPLAKTRLGSMVASIHQIVQKTRQPKSGRGWIIDRNARVVLLPDVGLPPTEAVSLLLRDAFGLMLPSPNAEWLGALVAPGESDILAELGAVRTKIAALESHVATLEMRRADIRRPLAALAQGEGDLEKSVHEILRRLGAEIHSSDENNKEDGRVRIEMSDCTLLGILEIKSTQRITFDERGLKQLIQWRELAKKRHGVELKGIFVGNSSYHLAPHERPDPFGVGFRRTAAEHDLAVITASTLLNRLQAIEDRTTGREEFWKKLFATRGVFEASDR